MAKKSKWIQGAVKHPGRCKHMGSEQCPVGSPQYNLAKRFKSGGDIHAANVRKQKRKRQGMPKKDKNGYY